MGAAYRIYTLKSGRITDPPEVIECEDDDAAIKQAAAQLKNTPLEVWEGERRIIYLEPNKT